MFKAHSVLFSFVQNFHNQSHHKLHRFSKKFQSHYPMANFTLNYY